MNTLIEIQHQFQFKTDKQEYHSYLTEYDKWFNEYKHTPGYFLELGVSRGGSMDLWEKYFSHMQIVGIDKNPYGSDVYGNPPTDSPTVSNRIHFHQEPAYTKNCLEFLSGTYKNFNIIVDDGSHELTDQIFVIQHYSKLISSGLLIVEDIPRSNVGQILVSCYEHLRNRHFKLNLIDNNNNRHIPPDRFISQNYGNVPLENSISDDSILCVEFFS